MSCCVIGCSNNRRFKPEGISFHMFPRGSLLQIWLQVLKKDTQTWVWSRNKSVCSNHFTEDDFFLKGGKKTLNRNAVPRVDNSPKHSTSNEQEMKILNRNEIQKNTSDQDCSKMSTDSSGQKIIQEHSYSISPRKIRIKQLRFISKQSIPRLNRHLKNIKTNIVNHKTYPPVSALGLPHDFFG